MKHRDKCCRTDYKCNDSSLIANLAGRLVSWVQSRGKSRGFFSWHSLSIQLTETTQRLKYVCCKRRWTISSSLNNHLHFQFTVLTERRLAIYLRPLRGYDPLQTCARVTALIIWTSLLQGRMYLCLCARCLWWLDLTVQGLYQIF